MKRLALFAVLLVLAGGIAWAQQDMGRSSVAGAGFTTGVVELFDKTSMSLREDSNRVVTILIVPGTVGADHELVGSRVRVTFHHNDNNQAIADEIQAVAGEKQEVAAAPVYQPTPTPAPAPTVVEKKAYTPAPAYTAPAPEPMVEKTLPRTASPLAAIGLLGLLSLGGALVVRFTR